MNQKLLEQAFLSEEVERAVVDYLERKLRDLVPINTSSYFFAVHLWNDIKNIVLKTLRDKGL
jgi:hypothetical protein